MPHAVIDSVIHSLSYLHYFALLIGFFFWLLLTVLTFVSGPVIGYFYVESYVKANHLADQEIKQLRFINKAIIKGYVTNDAKRPLEACRVMAMAFPKQGNKPLVPWLKSLKTDSVYDLIELKYTLNPGEQEAIYLSLSPVTDIEGMYLYTFTFCQ